MSTLSSVELWDCRVPLVKPLDFGAWILRERDYTILRLKDSDGAEGVAIGYSRSADITSAVRKNFMPALLGQEWTAGAETFEKLYLCNRWVNQGGIYLRALSLVDIALWDLDAKRKGETLSTLVGAKPINSEVTIACCYHSPGRLPADDVAEALELQKRGRRSLKICAADGGRVDTARLQAIREAVGEEMELKLDLHWLWQDLAGKEPWLREWEKLNLTWIEDVFPHEQAYLLKALKRITSLPIAYGDDQNGRHFFSRLIEEGGIDVLRMDATVVGGVSEFLRVGREANKASIQVSGHVFSYLHGALLGALDNATNVEKYEEDSGLDPIHQLVEFKNDHALWNWDGIRHFGIL
jgi:L-alanine-DL-glutamate epimerase-like enolase superfamily enzyme